jgi:hypothetical protein
MSSKKQIAPNQNKARQRESNNRSKSDSNLRLTSSDTAQSYADIQHLSDYVRSR